MLTNLLKYELKASARLFLPMYGAVIVLAVFTRLFLAIGGRDAFLYDSGGSVFMAMLAGIFSFLSGALIVAMFVCTAILVIMRFYRNLMGDEGYLMFTLPVPVWMLTASKMLASGIWTIGSVLAAIFAILILFPGWFPGLISFADIIAEFPQFTVSFLIAITQAFGWVLIVYFSIAAGAYLWPKHRILGAFGAYLITTIIMQIIGVIIISQWLFIHELTGGASNQGWEHLIGWLLLTIFSYAVFFVLTNLLLQRKLNLE